MIFRSRAARRRLLTACLVLFSVSAAAQTAAPLERREETAALRAALSSELVGSVPLGRDSVLRSFGEVPRHRFISGPAQALAYDNGPVPLGSGRFLPSPGEYAQMIAAAGALEGLRVLVAGPETGYLTALISRLAAEVVQIEFIPSRADEFTLLFGELNYGNIEVRSGRELINRDSAERFDLILLAYGTDTVPLPLIARLNQSGRLVGVLSFQQGEQLLTEYRKVRNGASLKVIGRVFFPGE